MMLGEMRLEQLERVVAFIAATRLDAELIESEIEVTAFE